ncbi:MAG: hypothetical protein ABI465_18580, partial [Ktedonobacteraceae bacterium]
HSEHREESPCHERFFAALRMTGGDGRCKKPTLAVALETALHCLTYCLGMALKLTAQKLSEWFGLQKIPHRYTVKVLKQI